MDPGEIIKAAPEIANVIVPAAVSIPFTGIVKRMLGPAVDELAEMWKDQIRLYRWSRQLKCIEKAEKMASDAGFTPRAVPPKILFPLLDGASMEDDDELHTMWAALLANASLETGKLVRPSFISLLREMAPDEAQLLRTLSERWPRIADLEAEYRSQIGLLGDSSGSSLTAEDLARMRQEAELRDIFAQKENEVWTEFREKFVSIEGEDSESNEARYLSCVKTLEEAGLVELENSRRGGTLKLSGRGITFMAACSPPKPKRS
jgi:hypothetical protein